MHKGIVLLVLVAGLTTSASRAVAQWVDFADETGARLMLTTIPFTDTEEKDIAAADFDHDGWTDLVVVRKRRFSLAGSRPDLLLMNEGGVLVDRTTDFAPGFAADFTDARDVLCADLTGDGWEDIVIATTFSDAPKFYRNLGLDAQSNWLGFTDESSRLGPAGAQSQPFEMCAVSTGDVDGDGFDDLYFSNYRDGGDDLLMINDGTGVFSDQTVARLAGGGQNLANVAFGTQNAIVDMDNDGDNDIVKTSTLFAAAPFAVGTYILWNDGTGHFSQFVKIPGDQDYMFAIDDLDGNGTKDIYIGQDPQDTGHLSTVNGPQSITWTDYVPTPSPRTAGFAGNLKLADIDLDGDLDLGVAPVDTDIQNCPNPGEFALLRNDGAGFLADPWPTNQGPPIHAEAAFDFAFLDVNNDGLLDMFFGNCSGYGVFIQQCTPVVASAPACIPALSISFPGGLPITIDPGVDTTFTIQIEDGTESLVPQSSLLNYRSDGGAFQQTQLTSLGGILFQATLPPADCGTTPEFFISAKGNGGTPVTSPTDAPIIVFSTVVGNITTVLADDFQTDQGWTVTDLPSGGGNFDGTWNRGVPIGGGDRGDPPTDSDGSGQCYLTDNVDGNSDVDNGTTVLTSAPIDMTGGAAVTYAYWLNDIPGSNLGPEDAMTVEMATNPAGDNWTLLRTYTTAAGSWRTDSIDVGTEITATDTMRIRFSVSDNAPGDVVEGGVDAVLVQRLDCLAPCPGPDGDFNGSGSVEGADIQPFVDAMLGTPSATAICHGDFNANGSLDLGDVGGMVAALLALP